MADNDAIEATQPEAGWYYVEGDPAGTVRRWNGEQWIGFAIPDPSKPASIHGTSRTTHTRVRLSQSGAILSVGAITALSSLAVVFVLTATRILRNVNLLRSATNDAPDGSSTSSEVTIPVRELGEYIPGVGRSHAARPLSHFEQGSVFATMLVPLFWTLWEAAAGAAATPGRNRSMFGVVSDTATASSLDPETGVAETGPIKIMVWWALWWTPLLIALPLWAGVWVAGPLQVGALATVLQLSSVLMILEAVSLLCIATTVGQITTRLIR